VPEQVQFQTKPEIAPDQSRQALVGNLPPRQSELAGQWLKGEDLALRPDALGKQQRVESHVGAYVPADHSRTHQLNNLPLLRQFVRT
jgi:hypothetical protein